MVKYTNVKKCKEKKLIYWKHKKLNLYKGDDKIVKGFNYKKQ